jgi:hypothetical protein
MVKPAFGEGSLPKRPKKAPARKPAAKKLSAAEPVKKIDKRGTPKGAGVTKGKGGGGKIGNPPHVPTPELRKLAETHAAVGTPHWAIAAEMAISLDTLSGITKRSSSSA